MFLTNLRSAAAAQTLHTRSEITILDEIYRRVSRIRVGFANTGELSQFDERISVVLSSSLGNYYDREERARCFGISRASGRSGDGPPHLTWYNRWITD